MELIRCVLFYFSIFHLTLLIEKIFVQFPWFHLLCRSIFIPYLFKGFTKKPAFWHAV